MKYYWIFIIVIFLFSCEKNIDFELDESAPTLVVEAVIENGMPPSVTLTKSIPYFSEISTQMLMNSFVREAKVYISNGTFTDTLKEYDVPLAPGYFFHYYSIDTSAMHAGIIGELNTTYQLRIVAEGKEYLSTTRIPGNDVRIDSLYFKPAPFDPDSNKRIMYLKATDPKGLGNYLRYFTKKNAGPFLPGPNSVYTDEVVDGTTFTVQLEPGVNRNDPSKPDDNFFRASDTVTLKFCNISKSTYSFWNTWEFANQAIGNPFSQPNKVLDNISNGALGAFCGYASAYRTIIVE